MADDMVKHVLRRDLEPSVRFANELTRATNKKHQENVRASLTSVEQRLRPHHDLADARVPRGDEDVPRPDALELVRERDRVRRRGEEREVDERVGASTQALVDPPQQGRSGPISHPAAPVWPIGQRSM